MTRAHWLASATFAAAIAAVAAMPARAQSLATYADRWTAAHGELEVNLPNTTISVAGTHGDSVHVQIRATTNVLTPLPILQRTPTGIRLSAPDNAVALEVDIRVPERFNAVIRGSNGGPITVRRVHGALSVENSNAGVRIQGARSPVVAATSNGTIEVGLDRLAPDGPYSFITSNAAVTLTLPGSDPNANLYLETDNGRILTDFGLRPWPEVQQIPNAADTGPTVRAVLGEGGPLIRIRTDNGDIHLRGPRSANGGESERTAHGPGGLSIGSGSFGHSVTASEPVRSGR